MGDGGSGRSWLVNSQILAANTEDWFINLGFGKAEAKEGIKCAGILLEEVPVSATKGLGDLKELSDPGNSDPSVENEGRK